MAAVHPGPGSGAPYLGFEYQSKLDGTPCGNPSWGRVISPIISSRVVCDTACRVKKTVKIKIKNSFMNMVNLFDTNLKENPLNIMHNIFVI